VTDDAKTPVDDPEHRQFVVEADGREAYLSYREQDGRLVLVHTEVPDELAGRGIGGALVRAALRRAERDHLVLAPWCPFARRWLSRHKDERGDVAVDWTSRPTPG
jgi:predicted GNAT family acetyltransferase